jgi:hypothetical protein
MTTALLDRLTHHCEIIETGNESLALQKPRLINQPSTKPIRARSGCATPTSFARRALTVARYNNGVKIGRRSRVSFASRLTRKDSRP